MTEPVGTLRWARSTNGRLSRAESRALLRSVIVTQLSLIPDQWLHKFGLKRPGTLDLDWDRLAPPDSPACAAARAACEAVSPPYLTNHSERSYWWGRILGELRGLKPDPELLYAAAMFHDLGLTEAHGATEDRPDCFTLLSIASIESTLKPLGWNDRQIDVVSEAITLHMNARVDLAYGAEAHLLNQATALDVTGLRVWKVHRALSARVLEMHPRCGQNAALSACFRSEASRFPQSRAGWLEKNLQFSKRVAHAPFAE